LGQGIGHQKLKNEAESTSTNSETKGEIELQNQIFVSWKHKRKIQLSKYNIELEMTVTEVTCERTNKLQETAVIHAEGDAKPGKLNRARTLQTSTGKAKEA
jgi:hypothetical protein